ncbi:MAG: DNA-processing protein DprA [Flavipsychrobacter sp.]
MLPNNITEDTLYQIALTFVKDIGPKTSRKLLSHFGAAQNIFEASVKEIKQVGGIGEVRAKAFKGTTFLQKAEDELTYIQKHGIKVLTLNSESYPSRLKLCEDAPVLLYYKGGASLNASKVVSIVGTRKYTDYGQRVCEKLIEDLSSVQDVLVLSGLAYGIDTIAHKAAVNHSLPTVGVLGHGLDMVYPASNKKLAQEMLEQGGLLSEYPSGVGPDKNHFPMRNRIVAGMADVTIVIESDIKGGAMITARVANGYNRDVAAFPGRVFDTKSSGCNELIRTNVAAMVTCANDVLELMNWDSSQQEKATQQQLFVSLTEEEQSIVEILKDKDAVHTDTILKQSLMSSSKVAGVLLQLELQGLVKALPGKNYRLN